ncbi:ChrR family anti-sigma-E factor [Pseudoteredinibacter isoporae]|uniref:Putative transcriptional regulator n=1 Tax=Pseudoteredinibacter isoporae TaxID=570281 RepID=A0A7X0JRM4_9GAMM|nr:ChrR family anti-sigma-E factor [Pseudoteredinibacter isoporae]MBB6520091.1 putative transcriptional regulator [Pseudoteredinibacter isoporae]NHO85663.1 transcriptional regulator [Pseudoteredinibacter isoporae]NIB25885.1 transcriptional regulator [Pseudoteredinibacter isoporae]
MNINHHPDDATLLSYAAGSLPESFDVLVACHLQHCAHCHEKVFQAEALAGQLLNAQATAVPQQNDSARDDFFRKLEMESAPTPQPELIDPRQETMPDAIQKILSGQGDDLPWKCLVPGMHSISLDSMDGGLKLLRIAPGRNLPMHSHQGSELTMVLQGAFQDELGCFYPGDVADLNHEVEHQPITIGNEACICLVAMDAPLQFKGLVPKLLQPFIGF